MRFQSLVSLSALCLGLLQPLCAQEGESFHSWLKTPPLGWNGWDAYGCDANEALIRANADFVAAKLKASGYDYVIVGHEWYSNSSQGWAFSPRPKVVMDEFGRLVPTSEKFPSSTGGKGFKPLADYLHGKGLKLGIQMLRGIPREALLRNTPIYGTDYHARQIVDPYSTCAWNPDMFGIDMSKPGAQEYYDSVFRLLASWDVDYVRVDDLTIPYSRDEIAAIRAAIDRCGREIILTAGSANCPVSEATHIKSNTNLWRVGVDLTDSWKDLKDTAEACDAWAPHLANGQWIDLDMLPLGSIHVGPKLENNVSRLTRDEQRFLMTLCCTVKSPVILGGHLPSTDEQTLALIGNAEVLNVLRTSQNNHPVTNKDGLMVWISDSPDKRYRYISFFNTRDAAAEVDVDFKAVGLDIGAKVTDLWSKEDEGAVAGRLSRKVPAHGACLYRAEPLR